jgi:hypothetical protein
LKQACIATRAHIGEVLENGVDKGLHDSLLSIYHQIWTPLISATLAQISKQSNTVKSGNNKVVTPVAEVKKLPSLPPAKKSEVEDGLWQLALTGGPLYPKLCMEKNCNACCELLFDLPLSKCSKDCAHTKLSSFGVFPHLSRKFMEKLKPHHGKVHIKVKQQFKPDTYLNPMYEVAPPEQFDKVTMDLVKGVDEMEIQSSSSASTSDQPSNNSPQQQCEEGPLMGESPSTRMPSNNWADTPEGSIYGDDTSTIDLPTKGSTLKRRPSKADLNETTRKVKPSQTSSVRRSSRLARQPY